MKKQFDFIVEFYDVDAMGVVWHGNYVKFCEAARSSFLRDIGYTYIDMKKDGYAYPLVKMDFKFIAPALFNDKITVSMELLEFDTLLKFKYYIFNVKTGQLLCTASTSQACICLATGETCFYLPECLTGKLQDLSK